MLNPNVSMDNLQNNTLDKETKPNPEKQINFYEIEDRMKYRNLVLRLGQLLISFTMSFLGCHFCLG